jgi:hypothetical protein
METAIHLLAKTGRIQSLAYLLGFLSPQAPPLEEVINWTCADGHTALQQTMRCRYSISSADVFWDTCVLLLGCGAAFTTSEAGTILFTNTARMNDKELAAQIEKIKGPVRNMCESTVVLYMAPILDMPNYRLNMAKLPPLTLTRHVEAVYQVFSRWRSVLGEPAVFKALQLCFVQVHRFLPHKVQRLKYEHDLLLSRALYDPHSNDGVPTHIVLRHTLSPITHIMLTPIVLAECDQEDARMHLELLQSVEGVRDIMIEESISHKSSQLEMVMVYYFSVHLRVVTVSSSRPLIVFE